MPSVAPQPGRRHSSVLDTSRSARSDCASPASLDARQCSARSGHLTLDSIDPGVLTALGAALTSGPLASVVGIDESDTMGRPSPLPDKIRARSPSPAASARAPGSALPPVTRVRRASAPTPTEPPPLNQRPRRGTADDAAGHLAHAVPPVSLAAGGQPRRTRCAQRRFGPLIYDLSTDADRARAATHIAAVVRGWLVRRRGAKRRERLAITGAGVIAVSAVGIPALLTSMLPPLMAHHLPLLTHSHGAYAEGSPAAAAPGCCTDVQAADHCAASAAVALPPLLHASPSTTSSGGLPAISPAWLVQGGHASSCAGHVLAAVMPPRTDPVYGACAVAATCPMAALASNPAATARPVPPLSLHVEGTVQFGAASENASLVPPPDGMPPAAFAALLAFVRGRKAQRRMPALGLLPTIWGTLTVPLAVAGHVAGLEPGTGTVGPSAPTIQVATTRTEEARDEY